jgi:2-oxo-4-hydroxy-4-carboxy--5-ureidoimidazoline (OHCU) decarboxylase
MNKASEYRVNARKCRALAAKADSIADREALLKMAELWEQLARDRVDLLRRHPDLSGDYGQTQGETPASTIRSPAKR